MKHLWVTGIFVLLVADCASNPKSDLPSWVHQPTRTVDAGYIVYVGVGEDAALEKAAFKSESMAMADLANECSIIPKGARVEDRYVEPISQGQRSFSKVGVTFEECEEAKKAVQPDDIRRLANVAMTEQLKRYQDLYYTAHEEAAPGEPGTLPQAPSGSPTVVASGSPHWVRFYAVSTPDDFFIARQQVVYQKQVVILSPATAYPPNAPQTTRYVTTVSNQVAQVQKYEVANPQMKTSSQSWSGFQSRPHANFPVAHLRSASLGEPMKFPQAAPSRPENGKASPRRRRRRRHN